jgi:small redox-active disulfide protein 2
LVAAKGVREEVRPMAEMDVTKIRVGKFAAGIIGLKSVLRNMAAEWADKRESETKAELVRGLSAKSYIPDGAKEDYGKAFLREFNKSIGKPYEETETGNLEIKILGAGCPSCARLEEEVMEVLKELNLPANIDHIRDTKEIGEYGVLGGPALIIEGKVKVVGRVPPRCKIIEWLKEAKVIVTSNE